LLFYCSADNSQQTDKLQSLLTMHAQQSLLVYTATINSQAKTPPQLLPSNRTTAASAYSTALLHCFCCFLPFSCCRL